MRKIRGEVPRFFACCMCIGAVMMHGITFSILGESPMIALPDVGEHMLCECFEGLVDLHRSG
jgi:hypothetical protein